MKINGIEDYPAEVREGLYETGESLVAINFYVASNLATSDDFLTSLVGWRTQRTIEDPMQRTLLSRLSDYERRRFREVGSMLGAGEDFKEIDRILGSNGSLTARTVFERARDSISSQDRRRLAGYANELRKVYTNMAEIVTWYNETKDDFERPSDNPFFCRLVDVYVATQDPFLLNLLFTPFIPFAKKVTRDTMRARDIPESGVADEEDYVMAVVLRGVLDLYKFQPWLGNKMTTFFGSRFAGAVMDEARELDVLSRRDRQRAKEYQRIFEREDSLLGTARTEYEIAEEMEITTRELREVILLANLRQLSLQDGEYEVMGRDGKTRNLEEQLAFRDPMDQFTVCTPETEILRAERIDVLERAIGSLSPEQGKLFYAYYVLGMTIKEIAESEYLGKELSASRVSQLMTKTRVDLKRRYEGMFEDSVNERKLIE